MKLTIEVEEDDIVVILKRPEGYEDVDADLLLDDAIARDWPQMPVVVWPEGS